MKQLVCVFIVFMAFAAYFTCPALANPEDGTPGSVLDSLDTEKIQGGPGDTIGGLGFSCLVLASSEDGIDSSISDPSDLGKINDGPGGTIGDPL
jgi:hypothetical protein